VTNLNTIFQNNIQVASHISIKKAYFDNKEDQEGSDPSVSVSIILHYNLLDQSTKA